MSGFRQKILDIEMLLHKKKWIKGTSFCENTLFHTYNYSVAKVLCILNAY